MRYLMPFLLGFAAKQLKKNNAAKGGSTAGRPANKPANSKARRR